LDDTWIQFEQLLFGSPAAAGLFHNVIELAKTSPPVLIKALMVCLIIFQYDLYFFHFFYFQKTIGG